MIDLFETLLNYTMRNREYYRNKFDNAETDDDRADVVRELLIDLSEEI